MYPIETFLDQVERVALMPCPTPLHRLEGYKDYSNVQVYIKRDDMTGIGPGGNKVRSLEYLLGEAKQQGADKVLASGPEQSNLCTLAAASCAKAGLSCELVHNGNTPERKEGNVLLNQILGVKSHFLGDCGSERRNAYVEELAEKYASEGMHPYIIRNGATTGRGALGYTAAVREMKEQCSKMGIKDMTIFAPGGNGGVAAGLIYGNEMMGNPFRIVIISIEDEREVLIQHIEDTIRETEQITGLPMKRKAADAAEITDAYRGEGWGVNTEASSQEIYEFARREGIFIENVYNSKVVVGMNDWINKGEVSGPVCYLHTGGFGSLFAQYE